MTSTPLLKGFALAALSAVLLPACGPSAGSSTTGQIIGAVVTRDDGTHYIVEPNSSGASTTMSLMSVSWGRLIDEVVDGLGQIVNTDLVIGSDIISDGDDYQIDANPISQRTTLTILHDFGTPAYDSAFGALFSGMDDLLPKSLQAFELPPYSMVPRNSVMVLRFSDLLDPDSISANNVHLLSGYTPTTPFSSRFIPDQNFGAAINGTFYSTRIIVDPVVSELESEETGLPVNALGLPGAINTGSPNLAVRIPTTLDFGAGQFSRLQNVAGNGLAGSNNAPFDFNSSTIDVIRALRTGGPSDTVQDPNNGFLPDDVAPMVVGNQAVTLTGVTVDFGQPVGNYLLDLTYANSTCATAPQVGDIITQPDIFVEVTADGGAPVGGSITGVKVRLLTSASGVPFPASASYLGTWDPEAGIGADCFVEFDPPAALGTNRDVDPTASVIIRFTEPMDPSQMSAFDDMVVSRQDLPLESMGPRNWVIGENFPSPDLKRYRFNSSVPMKHTPGSTEDYFLHLFSDVGIVDLAGNSLADSLPAVPFYLDPTADLFDTDHLAMRFGQFFDEPLGGKIIDDDNNGLADIRGQFVYDSVRGTILPRPVDRFSQTIDRNVGVPGWIVPNAEIIKNPGFLIGTFQEPLNPLGCRMMSMWRYFDMGLDVIDEAFVNIDVEHVNWAPIGSNVLSEFYPDFSISLATSNRTPDETWVPGPNTLIYPFSGLVTTTFDENVLLDPENPLTEVHQRDEGYFVDPIEKFKSDSETLMFPYPMNKYRQPEDFLYWTYRDTSITAVSGSDPGIGVEPPVLFDTPIIDYPNSTPLLPITGLASAQYNVEVDPNDDTLWTVANNMVVFDGTFTPSFALPILSEFRCYSSDDAVGLNRLDTSLAMDPSWTLGGVTGLVLGTSRPFTRVHSSGGADTAGLDVYKDPDLQIVPTGGFNEEQLLQPLGVATPPGDNVFYMGQLDFVVRVSRLHTVWYQAAIATPTYADPVMEPRNDQQPAGTSVNMHFRGATTVATGIATTDASMLNMYGNQPGTPLEPVFTSELLSTQIFGDPALDNATVSFDPTLGSAWTANLNDLDGLRFWQVRLTFINNAAAGTFPELAAMGFAYERL